MGKEKFIDSSILDKAINFATVAHKNTERRGKGVPYIVHPLEVVSIVASLTSDQEILAAAALHDTVEDTSVTLEDIKREFGERVANIVASESDPVIEGKSEEESWKERKQFAIDRLKKLPLESKMVALGDKLSNMRTIHADFDILEDKLWDRFHTKDPRDHEWHYRGLADALSELSDTQPYKEFVDLIDDVFSRAGRFEFKYKIDGFNVSVVGEFNGDNSKKLEREIVEKGNYVFDFSDVTKITFAGIRTLLRMYDRGFKVTIIEAINKVAIMFYRTGTINVIKVNEKFREFDLNHAEISGDGYTAVSYNVDDGDSMFKLYAPFISKESINREKQVASAVRLIGVPTPLSGNLIKVGNQYGVTFERIIGKKSFSRLLEANPDKYDEYAKKFAELSLNLHSTPCDTNTFESVGSFLKRAINSGSVYSEQEKEFIFSKLDEYKDIKTCLHGDFHIGNVIVTGDGDYLFIDMADFCYGDPRFDIAMLYIICNVISEKNSLQNYHNTKEVLGKFWKSFVKYYEKNNDPDYVDKYNKDLYFFVSMRMLYLAYVTNWTGFMCDLSRDFLKRYIENEK